MEKGTRRNILETLKRDGPQEAAVMAEAFGISAMAVRQHLYALAEEGLVEASSVPRGVGRPSKSWRLTDAADAFFPQGYAELTASLMSSTREAFGADGLEKLIDLRTAEQASAYGERMARCRSLATRLKCLAEIRTEEGYMAEVQRENGSYLFLENHCPICAVARSCTGLCASELELFKAVLGPGVEVERSEHILAGARRCAYRITTRSN